MNEKSYENIKEVLVNNVSENNFNSDFLLKLLEIELRTELLDEDKIKYLKEIIDLEGRNV